MPINLLYYGYLQTLTWLAALAIPASMSLDEQQKAAAKERMQQPPSLQLPGPLPPSP